MAGQYSQSYHPSGTSYAWAGNTGTSIGSHSSNAIVHGGSASARGQRRDVTQASDQLYGMDIDEPGSRDGEDKDMKKLNQANEKLRTENAELKRKLDEKQRQQDMSHTDRCSNTKCADEMKRLRNRIPKYQQAYDRTDKLESMTQALSRSRDQCKEWEDRTKTLEMELSDCKTRLSSLLRSKITDNNPHIADLSDPNRATKLAERYSELYDNQWTDAFEAYEEHFNNERESVEALVKLLQHIKRHCDDMAKDQVNQVQKALVGRARDTLSDHVFKQLKDLRKLTAQESCQEVLQKYLTDNRHTTNALESDKRVQPFVEECVKLCWLMSVQDPPLAFGPIPKYPDDFDTNAYKFYTKSGPTIAFVVWPALHLLEGEAMLSKGVAQGFGASRCKTAKGRSRESTGINSSARPQSASSTQPRDRTAVQHQSTSRNPNMGTSRVDGLDRNIDSFQMPRDDEHVFKKFKTYVHNYGIDSSITRSVFGENYDKCVAYYKWFH